MITNDAIAKVSTRPALTLVRGGSTPASVAAPAPPIGPPGQSERRLMLAILEDAILTVQRDARLLLPGKRRLLRETRDWFLADDPYWPFSFVNVCEALAFDASRVRSALAPFLDEVVPAPATGPGGW